MSDPLSKRCTACGLTKSLEDFHRHTGRPYDKSANCKECNRKKALAWHHRNRDKVLSYQRDRRQAENYVAASRLKNGFTKDLIARLLDEQGGLCAICGKGLGDAAHGDHDHITGEPRGLLCGPCNWGLGNFKDDPRLLTKAIDYLKKYDSVPSLP